jgi:hypothetical protein
MDGNLVYQALDPTLRARLLLDVRSCDIRLPKSGDVPAVRSLRYCKRLNSQAIRLPHDRDVRSADCTLLRGFVRGNPTLSRAFSRHATTERNLTRYNQIQLTNYWTYGRHKIAVVRCEQALPRRYTFL